MSDPNFRPNRFSAEDLRARILQELPGSEVRVENPNGDGYHYDLLVVWDGFASLGRVQQHQRVLNLFSRELSENILHAVTLKTFTTESWKSAEAAKSRKVGIE